MKVYLAGKIANHDWRHTIVDGLDDWKDQSINDPTDTWPDTISRWPVLTRRAQGHDYVGPYFERGQFGRPSMWTEVEDSHGVDASDLTGGHGVVGKASGSVLYGRPEKYQELVVARCKASIQSCDIVFAWMEEHKPTCYGTLIELGYAAAFSKTIILAGFTRFDFSGLWFAEAVARSTGGVVSCEGGTALEAFQKLMPSPRIDYHEYIRSPDWRIKAEEAKARVGFRCQVCNKTGLLDAHHRTYDRLGAELPEDITVLCRGCHAVYELNRKAQRQNGSAQ
jgi:hypothetical protein